MILDRILEHKRAEVRHKQSRGYLAELKSKIRDRMPPMGFCVTLEAMRHPLESSADCRSEKSLAKPRPTEGRIQAQI